MKKLISLFIIFATFLGAAFGKTVYVNANYPTNGNGTSWSSPYTNLQTAVTAAVAGDLVLVTNGVYSPISTGNKAITIQSVEGSSVTSIDGGGTARCITGSKNNYTTIIDGFTLVNGGSTNYLGNGGGALGGTVANSLITNCNTEVNYYGGGTYAAYLIGSTVTGCWARDGGGVAYGKATNCVIRGNSCRYNGGGVRGTTLIDCDIYENYAPSGGGGVYQGTATMCTVVSNSASSGGGTHSVTIYDSTISGNTAATDGGGSYSGTLTDCVISNNVTTLYDGGGTYNSTVTNCTISGNTANQHGGGAYQGTLTGCTIFGNTANTYGGGSNNSTLTGCTIFGNTANTYGGGSSDGTSYGCVYSNNVAFRGSATNGGTHRDSLFVNNVATDAGTHYNGGGLYNCTMVNNMGLTTVNTSYGTRGGTPGTDVINCIIYNNVDSAGTLKNYDYKDRFSFSCTQPRPDLTLLDNPPSVIYTDPQFTDPANNDFTLLPTSPCIDKGANQYVTTATDLLGSPRIKDWRVDMGAYESQSTRFVTTPNALFPMGTKDVK